MESRRDQLRIGMPVVGQDGERVGTVKQVGSTAFTSFLVQRSGRRDLWMLPEAIQHVLDGVVVLRVPADEADSLSAGAIPLTAADPDSP